MRSCAFLLLPPALLLGLGCRRKAAAPAPPAEATLKLVAVGDLIPHQDVQRAALQAGGWAPLWEDLTPLLREADLGFVNLETPVAPGSGRPGVPFVFNAPAELPGALKATGFTVLSCANNHAYDQGRRGLGETLARLEQSGLVPLGAGPAPEAAMAPRILERKGFRVAFLAFTDLLNGLPARRQGDPLVARLGADALGAVASARSTAHAVVVSVHWGNEYERQPSRRQRDCAARLVAAGADLVLGHHPHVLQPVEEVEAGGRKGIVAFSLGNFLSNQDRFWCADRAPVPEGDNRDGVALVATFRACPRSGGKGSLRLEDVVLEPLWTENNALERQAGRSARTVVRVLRLNAALQQAQDVLPASRERLRAFLLRRERIRQVTGARFIPDDAVAASLSR